MKVQATTSNWYLKIPVLGPEIAARRLAPRLKITVKGPYNGQLSAAQKRFVARQLLDHFALQEIDIDKPVVCSVVEISRTEKDLFVQRSTDGHIEGSQEVEYPVTGYYLTSITCNGDTIDTNNYLLHSDEPKGMYY
ncbi:MAG: hypothetical protein WC890_02160 [Candidatus Margulisiibacteriota bacterium]